MGNPTRSERILGPGTEAVAYGLAAVVNALAQALGQEPVVPVKNIDPYLDYADLVLRARQAADVAANDKKHYVARARLLWQQLKVNEPSLGSVSVVDLAWWSKESPRVFPKKPAVGQLLATGFAAWTQSSTVICVGPGLFGAKGAPQSEVAKILLRHEAKHVAQFLGNNDQFPTSYHSMAVFEAQAYAETKTEIDNLEIEHPDWKDDLVGPKGVMDYLVKFFVAQLQANSDSKDGNKAIKDAMVKEQLLPAKADDEPSNLYLP